MSLASGLMIYPILWWMVQPFGVRMAREEGGGIVAGQAASAPEKPRIAM